MELEQCFGLRVFESKVSCYKLKTTIKSIETTFSQRLILRETKRSQHQAQLIILINQMVSFALKGSLKKELLA